MANTGFWVWVMIAASAGFLAGGLGGALVCIGWFIRAPNARKEYP